MSKMDIPQPVFTIEPSEPKPEPQDVLIGCIKVDIYSQSRGVTGNVEEEALKTDSRSKPDIGGSEADSQVPRLGRSKGTDSPPQEDCQIFICEVCEEEFNVGVFLLKHKLDSHWIPIEMSLTHLPGHKTCMNCRNYLSESVEQNVAVFLTKPCKQCISGKCYLCKTCKSHFYLSDHFKTALKLKLLNPKGQSWQNSALILPKPKEYTWTVGSHSLNGFQPLLPMSYEQPATLSVIGRADYTKKPKQKELKENPKVMHQLNSALPENPPKKTRQKKANIIRTKTQVKADVKLKAGAQDSAKISETPLEQTPKQRKKKSCPQCGKTFARREGLTNHLQSHSGEKPFICDVCNKSFRLEEYLKLHQRLHTGEKPFTCGECGRGFARRSSFKYHCLTHTKTKQFQCDRCPQTFHRNADLQYHIARHNGTYSKKPRQKKASIIRTKTQVKADVKLKTGALDYAKISETPLEPTPQQRKKKSCKERIPKKKDFLLCPQCGKTFAKREGLTKHLKNHSGEKPFSCDVCNKSFMLQDYLKLHQRHHTGETPFTCGECGRGFARRSSFKYHCLTHTQTKQFQCDRCPKTYHRNADLQNHLRAHNGTDSEKRKQKYSTERIFICDVCGKGYARAYRLKDHKMTHTGELPHQCDACGKSYSSHGHLTDHFTNIHMKRTIPCPTCNKKFPTVVKMNLHCRQSHDAEKSFKCEECTMAFTSQKHLDRHMYTHNGKSPHMCEHCGRRFSTGPYCRAHKKKCY